MDAYRAIVTKRDTREFTDQAIAGEVLRRILQAGRMAGSAKNAQPVRFVLVRSAEQRGRLASCGRFTVALERCTAAVAVVLRPEEEAPPGERAIFRGPFDAGRAAQNLMVAAWAEGIASCPVSMHDAACAAEVLGLPEGHLVANVITLGYPRAGEDGRERRPRDRYEDYVHEERW